jgi:hypothetical protein
MEPAGTSRHGYMSDISGPTTATVNMRGYISRMASPDDPWPETYVVVSTSPESWMATFSTEELTDVLDGRSAARLRGIPCRWQGDELLVSFGPVHVRGDAEGWLALARRVVDRASSAGELLEAPGARPWSGPTVLLPVDAVDVPGEARGGGDTTTPEKPDSRLAAAGGFSDEEFRDLFGVGWRRVESPRQDELLAAETFLWGEPVQLAAQIDVERRLRVGLPSGRWNGPGGLEFDVPDPVPLDASMPQPVIESFVRDLLRRRRRAFSWCRYCGKPLAPEDRMEREVCYGCGTSVLGYVY